MSKSIKSVVALGLVVLAAACAQQQQQEEVVFVEEPIMSEPVSNKY